MSSVLQCDNAHAHSAHAHNAHAHSAHAHSAHAHSAHAHNAHAHRVHGKCASFQKMNHFDTVEEIQKHILDGDGQA